jgi:magnesium chelatase family protein
VLPVEWSQLDRPSSGPTSAELRERVNACRRIQKRRGRAHGFLINSEIPDEVIEQCVRATPSARRLLGQAVERLGLSARVAHRLLRVARTIADLAGDEQTGPPAVAEALSYRAAPLGLSESPQLSLRRTGR